ncbi:MAG: ATP-dependent DNA ligase, partial [Bryobacteraceae bacterium]|nr:ATP-dependent DNA ligase [Bryobacteraceae bacterium]
LAAEAFVLDGELVVAIEGKADFDALLQRIHPAPTRIRKLAAETPAQLILFDMLVADTRECLIGRALQDRRLALDAFAREYLKGTDRIRLSPCTADLECAKRWFLEMAGGLDGIIAKQTQAAYEPGSRTAMLKIKNYRSADCVVGGFRYAQKGRLVGSLLLGLYDAGDCLHHVGYTSSITAAAKEVLTKTLEAIVEPPGFTGAAPGGPSRWSTGRSTEWQPLRPELVVEVQYDHFAGGRFRHGTKLLRWRPEKRPDQCRIEQVNRESKSPLDLLELL